MQQKQLKTSVYIHSLWHRRNHQSYNSTYKLWLYSHAAENL